MFWPFKLVAKVVSAFLTLVIIYFSVTAAQVWLTGREHSANSAQAILVFGTEEDNGHPSPELRARLNHALTLYRAGRAPFVAVTGGKRRGDVFTEAGVSASYLEARQVPSSKILIGGGIDTWQNVASVLPQLRQKNIVTVLVVTDPFHEYRAMAIASAQGLTPFPSPVTHPAVRGPGLWRYYAKETLEVGVARIVGYRPLSQWLHFD